MFGWDDCKGPEAISIVALAAILVAGDDLLVWRDCQSILFAE